MMATSSLPDRSMNGTPVDMTNGVNHANGVIGGVPTMYTDVLVVGTGPAGGSLASFLASQRIKGLMIGMHPSTARTPRAHYTNPGTFECLRDIGIEQDARKAGNSRDNYLYYRFSETMAGEEYFRTHGFTWNPQRYGDYEESSPCRHGDVPQNVLEPIFVKYATQNGFRVRFDCKLVSFAEDTTTGLVTSVVQDLLTRQDFHVVSKYLCGADGANSLVASQLGLPFHEIPGGGMAINVWYEADLSHLCKNNEGLLHSCVNVKSANPSWAVAGVNRFIRPWDEWLMVILVAPGLTEVTATEEEILARTHELIGDDTVEIKLKGISTWRILEAYAERYTNLAAHPRVFCLGDAVHRHPPGNGLGSNTCIQDGYNLAWKLAAVLHGQAAPSILRTYNEERQPVGQRVVKIANDAIRGHLALYAAMGTMEPDVEERRRALAALTEATPAAAKRRRAMEDALEGLDDERCGLGAEMNQTYVSSAVVTSDELAPAPVWDTDTRTAIRYHVSSTYPGFRLPHAWLGPRGKIGKRVSTHDLAGKGAFALFTGIGGDAWVAAAKTLSGASVGGATAKPFAINSFVIGWRQQYEDTFRTWAGKRGVQEDGCVLVRPDRTVAWRCEGLRHGEGERECEAKLRAVLQKVLGFECRAVSGGHTVAA